MSLAKILPPLILETFLTRLAALFLSVAGGDLTAARQAAAEMLSAYHPETAEELRLATQLVSFSLHALDALGQAAAPDLPVNGILRLRGNAVSLNRESDKAQRRLEHIQQTRREAAPARPTPEPVQPDPTPETTPSPIPNAPAIAAKPTLSAWTTADQNAQDLRIAASIKRAEALVAARSNPPPLGAHASPGAP
jgi:hypothetical protein